MWPLARIDDLTGGVHLPKDAAGEQLFGGNDFGVGHLSWSASDSALLSGGVESGARRQLLLGLQQFRASFGLTQTELASWLGVNQANVAQAEKRTDMLVSTLRRYVEGITGGRLEFRITFPDRPSMRFDINEIESTEAAQGAAKQAA